MSLLTQVVRWGSPREVPQRGHVISREVQSLVEFLLAVAVNSLSCDINIEHLFHERGDFAVTQSFRAPVVDLLQFVCSEFLRTTDRFAVFSPPLDHLVCPFPSEVSPKLVERADNVEKELSLGRCQVDVLFQTDEIHPALVEVVNVVEYLLERSSEPGKFPDDDGVVLLGLLQEAIVGVALGRLPADSDVLVERDVVVVGVGPLVEPRALFLVAAIFFCFSVETRM